MVDNHVIVNYAETVDELSAAAHCPLGDLPLHFRQSINHFSFDAAYLVPDENERAHWRKVFEKIEHGLKIGVCWQTALPSKIYDSYFLDIHELAPIFSLKNATFINLQPTDCEQQLLAADLVRIGDGLILPGDDDWNEPAAGEEDFTAVSLRRE